MPYNLTDSRFGFVTSDLTIVVDLCRGGPDMVSRMLMTAALLVQLACVGLASADARCIEGSYRNPALGYSIKIPLV